MVRTTSGLAVVAAQQQQLNQALAAYSALLGRQGAPSQGWQASPTVHLPRSLAAGQVQAHMVGPTLASGFAPPPGGLPASNGASQAVGPPGARSGLLPSSSGSLGSGSLLQFGGAQPQPAAPSSAAGPVPALLKAGGPLAQASTTFAGHQQQQHQLLQQLPSLPSASSGQGFDLTFPSVSQAGQYTPLPTGQHASLPSLDAGMGLMELNGSGNLGLPGSDAPQGAGSGNLGQLQGVPGMVGAVTGQHLRLSCWCLNCPQQLSVWAIIITVALRAQACPVQCLPRALTSFQAAPCRWPGSQSGHMRLAFPSRLPPAGTAERMCSCGSTRRLQLPACLCNAIFWPPVSPSSASTPLSGLSEDLGTCAGFKGFAPHAIMSACREHTAASAADASVAGTAGRVRPHATRYQAEDHPSPEA